MDSLRRPLHAVVAALVAALAGAAAQPVAGSEPLAPAQIARAARSGGYVFLTLHADAPLGSDEVHDANATPEFLRDCSRQRQLSEEGQAHARAFGEAVRRLALPFATLLTSPYCRARETLALAFPEQAATSVEWLRSTCFAAAQAQRERRAALAQQLASAPPPGSNTLLLTHFCNVSTFARQTFDWCGISIEPGTSIVYRPLNERFEAIGCVPAETWREWGR